MLELRVTLTLARTYNTIALTLSRGLRVCMELIESRSDVCGATTTTRLANTVYKNRIERLCYTVLRHLCQLRSNRGVTALEEFPHG